MYKVKYELAPSFMKDIFTQKDLVETECIANNTRNKTSFYHYLNPSSSTLGLESLKHLGPRLWKMVPKHIKEVPSLEKFKSLIKLWETIDCPSKLCKIYVSSIGYIEKVRK